MLKKNVKFRKEIEGRIGVGFELPTCISGPFVPNVPRTAAEESREVLA
jgi:hypothetical protein